MVELEFIDNIVDIVAILISVYSLYMGFRLTKKLYGGKFTSVLPPLIASFALIFMKAIFELIFENLLPELGESLVFIFSIQMLQIIAGILLINALYQLYQVSFATAGFIEK
ncbi:hypothetical protein A2641_00990 [Candidatus Nomurabacteria bacterium RIFCSPHIGHO2_01_FULL_37_25]|nr:hypothetical protein [Candidatus Woesearchaeota archaeon]OGI60882.1 MAG: hypothetical protein A2641_00990 [Candidatus Nomurabacteria bacterium RIFCSPHIGHO2_01_FULL_37_25]